jgi:hypothetical protein
MPHSPSAGKEGKRLELPDDGLRFVSKRSFSRFLAMLSAALGISIKIDGATSSQSRDGELNFKLSPGGAAAENPFSISPSGVITPGTVNSLFPTLEGESIADTENVVDMEDAVVWLEMTWSVTWSSSSPQYLASATLSTITVQSGASLPADSATVKRFQLATIASGIATMSVQNNITAVLIDNGPDATALATIAAP